MTWDAFHRRGEVLRAVVHEAARRRDGVLPMDLPGVAETFRDELALLGALQLRWHTRLAGTIERELMESPSDLESAVLSAWRSTAAELAGVRMVLDAATANPSTEEIGRALRKAQRKDRALLAAMAGRASAQDARAAEVGRLLEAKARAAYRPTTAGPERDAGSRHSRHRSLLGRLIGHHPA